MVLDSQTIKEEGINLQYEEILAYCEQIVYRTVVCKPCVENGACLSCNCTLPDAMFVPKFECDEERFGPMPLKKKTIAVNGKHVEIDILDLAAWNKYKQIRGIKGFSLKY